MEKKNRFPTKHPMKNNGEFFSLSPITSRRRKIARNQYNLIVFCHLRWEFVYQRPQHILSRLARNYRILIVEEPILFGPGEENSFIKRKVTRNIDVFQPKVKSVSDIPALLKMYLSKTSYSIGWFYSAAFVPVLKSFEFETIVYDCMDELSLFKGASSKIIEQEKQLMKKAHVVFTGGMSLFESKNKNHHNTHCFRSSVDEAHFGTACNILQFPEDIAHISNPIVGYFGVIDERIDLELLRETALRVPNVAFVMIGPVVKIQESDLPRMDNIHYLGQKSYEELPSYLAAFDIAMMPFALNDSTKYISPTKTLEYMAAKKPIISTKIKDVVRDYGTCVNLIDNVDDFCNAINNSKIDYYEMLGQYEEILSNTSWDATVEKMKSIINKKFYYE